MRQILYLFLVSIFLFSCSNNFSVKGKIENMPEQSFRLEELGIEENVLIDSSKTTADGSFELKANGTEEKLYRIRFEKGKYILLALQNGDHAIIDGKWHSLEDYQITGSKGSESLKSFLVNLRENITDINTMQLILDSLKGKPGKDSLFQSAEADLKNINSNFMQYIKKYADTTQSVASALFAVNMINPAYEGPYIAQFYETIKKRFPNSKSAAAFAERFYKKASSPNESETNPTKGEVAPDFSGNTPNGETIKLSDFKGKYVLIDFWASWCAPCRAENPTVVSAYNNYKNKNFTILGVSLDSSKEKWNEAIAKDQLTWSHISELKGWGCAIARNYKVESIPQNFLIDPQGNIIAQNLKGADLEKKLAEILH